MNKNYMHKFILVFIVGFNLLPAIAQTPKTYTSSEILLQIKKLNVLGSVLYIAAHPDDENTRLLAWLANEKLYRTGYLSLTRGDGGQNLIGDEQGIDLGLIRTQELLSARRIDGAEQFFSRAYDFGFCKSSEEALATWGHDKILSDVVWVIRKFKPDVIISRFPEDSRAGHGHHAASGILAREAFDAAADSTKFREQLSNGVTVWQAKRLLWNTFNFGNTNTQSELQFKVEVGMYNPLLGKGYGEIAALSRSQHKSQGFGVPAQRGSVIEYFTTVKGDKPVDDLMDGVETGWARINKKELTDSVNNIIRNYDVQHPANSIGSLIALKQHPLNENYNYWVVSKNADIDKLIESTGGLFMEATAFNQLNVIGDSIKINLAFNNRGGIAIDRVMVSVFGSHYTFENFKTNETKIQTVTVRVSEIEQASQPYWLERGLEKGNGSFDVRNQSVIGNAENYNYRANFQVTIGNVVYHFFKPVLFKYTDPVKGELYQPVQIVNPVFINSKQHLMIFKNTDKNVKRTVGFTLHFNTQVADTAKFRYNRNGYSRVVFDSMLHVSKTDLRNINVIVNSDSVKKDTREYMGGQFSSKAFRDDQFLSLLKIKYDHIPDIYYNYYDRVTILKMDLKTAGKRVGYIPGAGDKVAEALEQMGYQVTILKQSDLNPGNLKQFDAVVTGVRAYNTNEWLNNVYDALMEYVKEGGILLTQYNTSNQIGPVKAKIAPYPFTISRNRVTDETAGVHFLIPEHPALNYPNKITQKDFEGWVQERSIYNAEKADPAYQHILSMKDPGEGEQDGSLIIANYGRGRFIYTGLVFFRELPAGVPGAYRLLANLIAVPVAAKKVKQGK
ncbi:MAG: PIG-L family deacetylase [Ferruginibacter sp.]|nr:PIG-L family deacetylase [Ferruginibacter sp.]